MHKVRNPVYLQRTSQRTIHLFELLNQAPEFVRPTILTLQYDFIICFLSVASMNRTLAEL